MMTKELSLFVSPSLFFGSVGVGVAKTGPFTNGSHFARKVLRRIFYFAQVGEL
jgi:hypothetical protein